MMTARTTAGTGSGLQVGSFFLMPAAGRLLSEIEQRAIHLPQHYFDCQLIKNLASFSL
jgi:hypothetical protein